MLAHGLFNVGVYREVAEEKGIAVATSTPQDLWLRADRNRMRQVLANPLIAPQ
jgi:signal transduction histidine kinase